MIFLENNITTKSCMPVLCFVAIVLIAGSLIRQLWKPIWELSQTPARGPSESLLVGQASYFQSCLPVIAYGVLYAVFSATLIKYNKFLMTKERFPYAVNLTLGHMVSGSIFLFVLRKLVPSAFPSLEPDSAQPINWRLVTRSALPIAFAHSGQLVLSNAAYIYSSVAFIQMMKEGNLVLVYILSLIAGLEHFHSARVRLLICLALSTALTIQGEIAFSATGFMVQSCSQCIEAMRIVMQSILLSSAGQKQLDALSYNLCIMPPTSVLLSIFLGLCCTLLTNIHTAPLAAYLVWWPHLVANALVALALNICIALFISRSSAVGFIIVGILKDMSLIIIDVVVSGTELSDLQVFAFALQLVFAVCYSLFKVFGNQQDRATGKLGKSETS